MTIIQRLQSWALMAFAVMLVIFGAYTLGGRAARTAADKRREYEDALRRAAGAKEVHDAAVETNKLPEGAAAGQLRSDWVRDDET